MNLSVKERIVVVLCIGWLVLQHSGVNKPYEWEVFWFNGVLPVVIIFGIVWVRRGRKEVDGPG